MTNDDGKSPIQVSIKYEKMHKILTLDERNFEPCHPKEVEQWSWKHLKNEKYFVHLQKSKQKWSIKKLP